MHPTKRPLLRPMNAPPPATAAEVAAKLSTYKRGIEALPPTQAGGRLQALTASIDQLSPVELAAPGWAVRVGMNAASRARIPLASYWLDLLRAEVRFSVGGVEHLIEADAFPGFSLHVVADAISVDLLLASHFVGTALPALPLQLQLGRGLCPTTAYQTYDSTFAATASRAVPSFATTFAINNPAATALEAGATLTFHKNRSGQVVQVLDYDQILELLTSGAAFPVPAGASWFELAGWGAAVCRLVFFFGEVG